MSLSTQSQWNAAVREIRKRGVTIKQNVMSCCNGCIDAETLNMSEGDAYAYTFGGQGQATRWENDVMVQRHVARYDKKGPIAQVYFKHGDNAAQTVVDVFTEYGFPVEWDGTDTKAVIVTPHL